MNLKEFFSSIDLKVFTEAFIFYEMLYYIMLLILIYAPFVPNSIFPDSFSTTLFDPRFIIINSVLVFVGMYLRLCLYKWLEKKDKEKGGQQLTA